MLGASSVSGGVAQLGERFGRIEEVVGSIPIASTEPPGNARTTRQ
jgi:hypothetical protein